MKKHTNIAEFAWLVDFVSVLKREPQSFTAAQFAARIHEALVGAGADQYATDESRFRFTVSGASPEELAEIRAHLTAAENRWVELEVLDAYEETETH